MKFVAILFSIFIFYMVSVPCVDELFHEVKSSSQENPCNHGDHDACTPFCVCSCCGIVVVVSNITFDSQPDFIIETEFLSSNKDITSHFLQSFWQPPKLS